MTVEWERRRFDPEKARERAADAAFDEALNLPRKHRSGFGKRRREVDQ